MFLCVSRLPTICVPVQVVQLLASHEPQPVHTCVLDCARSLVVLAEQPAPIQLQLAQLLPVPVLPEDLVPLAR